MQTYEYYVFHVPTSTLHKRVMTEEALIQDGYSRGDHSRGEKLLHNCIIHWNRDPNWCYMLMPEQTPIV